MESRLGTEKCDINRWSCDKIVYLMSLSDTMCIYIYDTYEVESRLGTEVESRLGTEKV